MSDYWSGSFIDLSLHRLSSLWREVSDRGGRNAPLRLKGADLTDRDLEAVRNHMRACLEGRHGSHGGDDQRDEGPRARADI